MGATWRPPPIPLALGSDEVHVWRAGLDLDPARLVALEALLHRDERGEADRFRTIRDRSRFVAARALLRAILGRYLGAEPAALTLHRDPRGKPRLAAPAAEPLHFNVSHSEALALYAVAWRREVGVDVERVRTDLPWPALAARFFAPAERAALSRGDPQRGPDAFARIWTAKEAYLKAIGRGLDAPLQGFSVAPGDAPVRLGDDEGLDHRRWLVIGLDAGPGYAAALAAEGEGWGVRLWQWDGDDL